MEVVDSRCQPEYPSTLKVNKWSAGNLSGQLLKSRKMTKRLLKISFRLGLAPLLRNNVLHSRFQTYLQSPKLKLNLIKLLALLISIIF